MKKFFTVIRQGKIDEVKSILERKSEVISSISTPPPQKDRGGETNRQMYVDDFVPQEDRIDEFTVRGRTITHVIKGDEDFTKNMREIMRKYYID